MKLNLCRTTTIGDVKQQFARSFPYLKLEVFPLPHASRTGSLMQLRMDDNHSLSQIKTFYREGTVSFEPSMTLADFEKLLEREFGLHVKVFHKSSVLWQETIHSDNLSLESQNDIGEAAHRPMHVNPATLFL